MPCCYRLSLGRSLTTQYCNLCCCSLNTEYIISALPCSLASYSLVTACKWMDCNIIVHKLTVILIFTELDSRQCKPFSKASQGSNLRNNVMEARFILFRVTNPLDLMVRQMNMIGNVLQQLFGVGVGNILLSQLRSNSKRYSKSRTIFFWRNLGLNTVRYA